MKLQLNLAILSGLASTAVADWQFKSRPDLAVPRLNITIPAGSDTSPGYLFAAPFSGFPDTVNHGPRQSAPYIFTDQGELVWSGFSYFSAWTANFQYGRVDGQDVLFSFEGSHNSRYGHGHGHITLVDQNYETIKELRAGKHKIADKHEFNIIDEKTGLIEIYQPVVRDLTPYGASSKQQWIIDAIFQEIDLESGKVLFEWSSLDWLSPEESVLPVTEGQAGSGYNSSDAWDYFHINSIDKDAEGNYLLSARDASALYKINGTSGEVIWKLGGLPGINNSSFTSDFTFSFQHHARYLHSEGPIQRISFYDNSAHGTEDKDGNEVGYSKTSSGKIIEVNTATWEAKLIREYLPPDDLLSKSQGSTQVLPDGHVIVNWGSSGAVTEFTEDGKPLFHAYFDSDSLGEKVENYRAFKYNWTGVPNEDIAVVGHVTDSEDTLIYVSWNGDTSTKTWRFYTRDENNKKHYLGKSKKTGFETVFKVEEQVLDNVQVEAVSDDGELLKESDFVRTQVEVLEFEEEFEEEIEEEIEEPLGLTYFEWKLQQLLGARYK